MALSRRSFLAAGAGALVVAACGGGGSKSGGDDSGATALVARYEDGYFVPGSQRVAVSLGNTERPRLRRRARHPRRQGARRQGRRRGAVGRRPPATRRARRCRTSRSRCRWPRPASTRSAPRSTARTLPSSFSVVDPSQVKIPKAGDKLPPFDTPTTADGTRGQPDLHPPAAMPAARRDADPGAARRGKPVGLPDRHAGVLPDRRVRADPGQPDHRPHSARRQGGDGARRGVHGQHGHDARRRRSRPTT